MAKEIKNMNPEIKVGDFITVEKWTSHYDRSYTTDCLEVLVVDAPLIRVKNHSWAFGHIHTLSLNDVLVRHLSKEFVDSVIHNPRELATDPS